MYVQGASASAIELMDRMLNYIPEKRISCRELLAHPYFSAQNSQRYSIHQIQEEAPEQTKSFQENTSNYITRSSQNSRSAREQFSKYSPTHKPSYEKPMGTSLTSTNQPQTLPSRAYSYHAHTQTHSPPPGNVLPISPSPIYQYKLIENLTNSSRYGRKFEVSQPEALSMKSSFVSRDLGSGRQSFGSVLKTRSRTGLESTDLTTRSSLAKTLHNYNYNFNLNSRF